MYVCMYVCMYVSSLYICKCFVLSGISLPETLLDEPENKREDLEESELVYNQAIRYNVLIKLIQHNFSDRLLTNHDSSLPGIKGKKITAMSVFVQDKKFSLNKLDKKEFEEERKLVNSNTLLGNIQ